MDDSGFVIMFSEPTHVRGAALTALVCLIWIGLAWRSPELNYHFAPLIASVLWPLSLRSQGRRATNETMVAAVGSAGFVFATTLALVLFDKLEGPNFLERGPAWPEALLFGVIGAAFGARSASRERPGLLGGLVDTTS
ncbi:MAG: hypothetical protein R8J94_20690 [Acidimicrobiia bacterium]|nr:hypothetical protein [Acidimicrobiia bacterium]